ncbi:MAG: hypothetical protein IRZ32_15710 [Solirubrobacteraceae bacterium]|nr:hypothetical protein [Solirubrobacteraceae bacterium]
MICPHCSASLLRRERTGKTCSRCRKPFVFEPRDTPLRLHDLKVRRFADRVSDGGRIAYTDTQLWYALSRKHLRQQAKPVAPGCLVVLFLAVLGVAALIVALATSPRSAIVFVPVAAVLGPLIYWWLTRRKVRPPLSLDRFRNAMFRWQQAYQRLPVGMLPLGANPQLAQPEQGPATPLLVCADADAAACLAANGVPPRFGLRLVTHPRWVASWPLAAPVLVLRDASIAGEQLVMEVRQQAGGRPVVDLGLSVTAARQNPNLTRLRLPRAVDRRALAELRANPTVSLTEADVDWLAEGWSAPIAALPPDRLIGAVAAGADRAAAAGDPARAAARAVGFLSWPAG